MTRLSDLSWQRISTIAAVLLLLLYALLVLRPAVQQKTAGFATYYTASYLLRTQPQSLPMVFDNDWFAAQVEAAGIDGIHDIFWVNLPTMSLLLLPLTWLEPATARALWILFNFGCLIAGLYLTRDMFPVRGERFLWLLLVVLLTAPVRENLRFGQAYLFLFMLLCVVMWALARGKTAVAGLALGLMLILKTAGAWLALLLFFTRRWRVLLWAGGTALLVALVTLPWIGLDTWLQYLVHLSQFRDDPRLTVTAYQTITSLTGHLFVYNAEWNPQPVRDLPALAQGLRWSLFLVTLGVTAWVGRRRGKETAVAPVVLALFTAPIVANAPIGEGYHYALVLPALLITVGTAVDTKVGGWQWLWLGGAAALLLLPLPYKSPRLTASWLALLAYPRVHGALLLWAWNVCALFVAQNRN